MKKLKVAFLWHFHQPFYKKQDEFILPWVRLHGVKDYNDLPEIFYEFPQLKQTINIVPSLFKQIDEYIQNGTKDKIQLLSEKKPEELTSAERADLLRLFFVCNIDHLVNPYAEFRLLHEKAQRGDSFTNQEILDLQVWYNLSWIGMFSRRDPAVAGLFLKGSNFTDAEKKLVLEYHLEILNKIGKTLSRLSSIGQLELSVSPLNHPILPLLCDSHAMNESLPKADLPSHNFKFPQDAQQQVFLAKEYYKQKFGYYPAGMWPSEGSLSDEVLDIIIGCGMRWAATDEVVLQNSLKEKYRDVYKYFPIKYNHKDKDITLFFRDHSLSDAIGFQYAGWKAEDAAGDFCSRLCGIKKYIVEEMGENALDNAVVPVILDGENCWEYYPDNGINFLRQLFGRLTGSPELETVLFSDECGNFNPQIPECTHLQAGSWIDGNFDIWMGHREHRIAWDILAQTRTIVENKKNLLSAEQQKRLFELVYIAESSDWFWWYGDKHNAPNKPDFDVLFRWYLSEIYKLIGIKIPTLLNAPLGQLNAYNEFSPAKSRIQIPETNIMGDEEIWKNSALYLPDQNQSSMHRSGSIIKSVNFGNDEKRYYTRIILYDEAAGNEYHIHYKIKDINEIDISQNSIETRISDFDFRRNSNSIFISFVLPDSAASDEMEIEFETDFKGNHIKFDSVKVKIMK